MHRDLNWTRIDSSLPWTSVVFSRQQQQQEEDEDPEDSKGGDTTTRKRKAPAPCSHPGGYYYLERPRSPTMKHHRSNRWGRDAVARRLFTAETSK
mmetsp:Transcript_3023/g.5868  ORF Transcript_3023/g.5868 Transcript_3023/m.5868 type:complete len:95 (+) Transcript_3023:461-745(+)